MKAIITVGVSGSGKSTWAEMMSDKCGAASLGFSPDIVNINRDEERWSISGKRGWNGPNAYKFDKHIEAHVTKRNNDKIVRAALSGKDIIISDTNLNPKVRKELIETLKFIGYEVEIKEFDITFQEAMRRDATRGIYSVGEAVLLKQWEMYVKYHEDKQTGAW